MFKKGNLLRISTWATEPHQITHTYLDGLSESDVCFVMALLEIFKERTPISFSFGNTMLSTNISPTYHEFYLAMERFRELHRDEFETFFRHTSFPHRSWNAQMYEMGNGNIPFEVEYAQYIHFRVMSRLLGQSRDHHGCYFRAVAKVEKTLIPCDLHTDVLFATSPTV